MRPKIKTKTYREAHQEAKLLGASIQLFTDKPMSYAAAIKRLPPDGFLIFEPETRKWTPAKFASP
jgi:hypothetical protein